MDTSETYIKMCACPEIQKEMSGRPKLFLAYYLHGQWQVAYDYLGGQKSPVLLPMQDQIQEMCAWKEPDRVHQWLIAFFYFLVNEVGIDVSIFNSPEQLWLAFYMDKEHNLIWDGDEWEDNG